MKAYVDPNLAPLEMNEEEQKAIETEFGFFLRKTSLDETPQSFNIVI